MSFTPPSVPVPALSVGPPPVFISFIHEEQKVAEAIQQFIQEVLKVRVFISSDKWAVFAGEQWLERIKEALTNARIIVLMLSPESVKRPWVHFEAGAAWLQNRVIIPACINNLTPSELSKPYSNFQSLDLTIDGGPYYLLSSIAHHLNLIPPPPDQQSPAYVKFKATLVSHSAPLNSQT